MSTVYVCLCEARISPKTRLITLCQPIWPGHLNSRCFLDKENKKNLLSGNQHYPTNGAITRKRFPHQTLVSSGQWPESFSSSKKGAGQTTPRNVLLFSCTTTEKQNQPPPHQEGRQILRKYSPPPSASSPSCPGSKLNNSDAEATSYSNRIAEPVGPFD